MLAAAQRLRRSSDFAAAIRGGRRAGRGAVVVHLSPARSTPTTADPDDPTAVEPAPARSIDFPARAGFVVSKAVGPAVVRNTVRRRLRHLMRDRLAGLPAGATVVVRALPAAAATPYAALAADVDAALAAAARAPRPRRDPARRAEPV